MNEPRLIRVPCPVCASALCRELFLTRDYKQGVTNDEFIVSRCLNCGAGYLSLRPSREELLHYYDERFYWSFENDESVKEDAAKLLEFRQPQLEAKAAWLGHLAPGKLLDVGTMKGEFLYYMKVRGWEVEGVEFSTTPPNVFDMPIRYGDFLAMESFGTESFDCITMWAVLEHVYQPADYVARVAELLKPGGRFIFLVTNFNSIQGRIYEMDDYPRHLTMFTRRSVRRLLQQAGLASVRTSTDQSIFGGRLPGGLVYLAKRAAGYPRRKALEEWKNDKTLKPFFHAWRGDPRLLLRLVARADWMLLTPLETLLDRLGLGFILTVEARKSLRNQSSAVDG